MDLTEGRLSIKPGPSTSSPNVVATLNDRVLARFTEPERASTGVRTCPGGDQGLTHALDQRIFIGVIDPVDPVVETAGQVRDRVLRAAGALSPERLGTCIPGSWSAA
ncbi:hypothetical protein AB0H12_35260 [Actinosynnema sp. NPDC023794]